MIADEYISDILESMSPQDLAPRYFISAIITDRYGHEFILTDDELDDLEYYQASPDYPQIKMVLDMSAIRRDVEIKLVDFYQSIYDSEY